MRLNAKQIAAYTGGQFLVDPIDASALMTGITWDSREVRPGWLYVALPGERVDGHQFVEAALRAGAAGALVTDAPSQSCALLARELGAAIIEVPNTASAITDLARAWRSHLRGRVIGLTGSVGKTTTKNLTRDVCAAYGSVVATKANQNNELGVPRTLLNADPETAVVVVEMGMRGLGQIAELCDFVRPVWGLITNVGESHIELLGSRENIARAKSELFEALPAGVGRAFANLDDDFATFMAERGRLSERSVALSGFAGHPDAALRGALERESAACDQAVWAEDVSLDAEGRPRFTLPHRRPQRGQRLRRRLGGFRLGARFGHHRRRAGRVGARAGAPGNHRRPRRLHGHQRRLQREPRFHARLACDLRRHGCGRPAHRRARRHGRARQLRPRLPRGRRRRRCLAPSR